MSGTLRGAGFSISQTAFNLKFIQPDTNESTFVFATLSALIFLLLLALTYVLLRNVLKLYAERRVGALGSKFRTRMLVGAILLSVLPVIAQFGSAYILLNRSIDKWFSLPVEEVREDTEAVANMLSRYVAQNARAEAYGIASQPEVQRAFQSDNFAPVVTEFRRHEATLQGGFALALLGNELEASFSAPAAWALLRPQIPMQQVLTGSPARFSWQGHEYLLSSTPVGTRGLILVAMPLPPEFNETLRQIEASQQRYLQLARERKLVRRTYLFLLLLITASVLFAATWLALFVAKLVTRPVEALGEAMQEISDGKLGYRLEVSAADELGDLVRSFNRMAAQLENSRRQIEASSRDLADANAAVEQRRRHIETILESIPTGVISLGADRAVTHVNSSFLRMFRHPDADKSQPEGIVGGTLEKILPSDVVEDLQPLLRRADRMGTTTTQMEMTVQHTRMNVAVTVATLQHMTRRLGYVLVFEDLSDLLKAQKQAAWSEVARRVAHEIKNPLTPIALSAERIRRYLEPDDASVKVIDNCAQTIGSAVETVRTLVDEFSTLARFPAAHPHPEDVNKVVSGALAMFDGRLDGILVRSSLAPDLPKVSADAESLKRAIANLVDNAAEAMKDSLVREIHISTALVASKDAVEIVVADSGHGVSQELKEKLFLPYFSTKQRGTGLGLAIVNRIVEEHQGSIRVEENSPVGARFIIELPAVTEPAAVPVATPAASPHA
jgi:two-component system, NtrC family, nitrogen regulation sensor histidine kinase NtrY